MRVEQPQAQPQAPPPGAIRRASGFVQNLLVLMMMATGGWPAFASEPADDPRPAQQQASQGGGERQQNQDQKDTTGTRADTPPKTPDLCQALGAAAAANALPADFFTRLIWQESRFRPDVISAKGAQGIAQFMPATARASGLDNPFDPLDAITKSGELLRDLRREFGNLGLAAAAYNAGAGRVHDWLGSRRQLPRETRAYVKIVTGRSVEEWTAGNPANPVEMPSIEVPCGWPVTAFGQANPETAQTKSETGKPPIKPWGVEVVGATTPANALARYRDWQPKYAGIVGGRETNVVIRGVIGQSGAARVRVGEDSRAEADKLCMSLKAAGAYCDVMRN
jgi:Transglycosylase SLT domain